MVFEGTINDHRSIAATSVPHPVVRVGDATTVPLPRPPEPLQPRAALGIKHIGSINTKKGTRQGNKKAIQRTEEAIEDIRCRKK